MSSLGLQLSSVLQRSDSKDPTTTCRGRNKNGARCRRNIGKSSKASRVDPLGDTLSVFYCHHHKDQAGDTRPAPALPNEIRRENSRESLLEKLGVSQSDAKQGKHRRDKVRSSKARRSFCFLSMDSTGPSLPIRPAPEQSRTSNHQSSSRRTGKMPIQDLPANVRVSGNALIIDKRPESAFEPRAMEGLHPTATTQQLLRPPTNIPYNRRHSNPQHRPFIGRNATSQTEALMRLIPQSLSPETVAALLAELVKPFSAADKAGYIYMYCLTDREDGNAPSSDLAASLLGPPSSTTSRQNRRKSEAMRACAIDDIGSNARNSNGKVFLLKIGRSNDVQRRMREWQYKCGFRPSIIRQYPYLRPGTAPSPTPPRFIRGNSEPPPNTAGMIPRASRVERLIHIELAEYRKSRWCEKCLESHTEWFSCNDITTVSHVDGVIRKWVDWSVENS